MGRFRNNGMEKIVLMTEKQKDNYIDRLEDANVDFEVFVERESIYSRDIQYVIRVKAEDLKKVS